MILGSIEYANEHGFTPSNEWRSSKYVIEFENPFEKKFTFGLDGKPFFINGPNDDVKSVMAKLQGKSIDYHIYLGDGVQISTV